MVKNALMIKHVGKVMLGITNLNVACLSVTNAQKMPNGMVKHVNVQLDTMLSNKLVLSVKMVSNLMGFNVFPQQLMSVLV
jgi:hypothetical protein